MATADPLHDLAPVVSAPKRAADWRWERNGCRVYSSEFHRGRPLKVADVAFGELDEAGLEARGRLIAAAPDLLEAAKEGLICAEADVEEARRDCIEHGEDPDADRFVKVFTERRDLIRAAIAKATGADQ